MLLDVRDLHVRYGRVHAVRGITLTLGAGQVVAVVGANGAGKSSLLRAILGIEKTSGGSVGYDGTDITRWSASERVKNGLVLVPEGRRIVMTLTVHENLLMGAFNRRLDAAVHSEIDGIYDRFPNLAARRDRLASVLSGGEQQMLAIGRALLAAPRVMMLDEPSLGLSPILSAEVFEHIASLGRDRNIAVLLVEQNTQRALELADHAYVIELGRVVSQGPAEQLLSDHKLIDAYLGHGEAKAGHSEQQRPVR
ncbi:MAG: ABC transporter ATP-binding protein [Pseudorhodoplanes sp.]|uniref:ABC transporter ATP-binding protein n=1 Tax=Pseudorhodoplanes sp. TaxID=1934341 RepID=UPI003D118C4D